MAKHREGNKTFVTIKRNWFRQKMSWDMRVVHPTGESFSYTGYPKSYLVKLAETWGYRRTNF